MCKKKTKQYCILVEATIDVYVCCPLLHTENKTLERIGCTQSNRLPVDPNTDQFDQFQTEFVKQLSDVVSEKKTNVS